MSDLSHIIELFAYPLDRFKILEPSSKILFVHAVEHSFLKLIDHQNLVMIQPWKGNVLELENRAYSFVYQDFDQCSTDRFDVVLLNIPQNVIEAHYLIARSLKVLKNGGSLICVADNKANGKRLAGWLGHFTMSQIAQHSQNKARVVWGKKEAVDLQAIGHATAAGELQTFSVENHSFYSIPGIFGWNKIDKGSEILVQYLPQHFSGKGADFGCGYGYLAQNILERALDLKFFSCVDADFRALNACRHNLERYGMAVDYVWDDLVDSSVSSVRGLDFIVMNPPFHEGKILDIGVGVSFIRTAYGSLKSGGKLWMVSNVHLPYEEVLADCFSVVETLYEGRGFKVFCAIK